MFEYKGLWLSHIRDGGGQTKIYHVAPKYRTTGKYCGVLALFGDFRPHAHSLNLAHCVCVWGGGGMKITFFQTTTADFPLFIPDMSVLVCSVRSQSVTSWMSWAKTRPWLAFQAKPMVKRKFLVNMKTMKSYTVVNLGSSRKRGRMLEPEISTNFG